MDKFTKRKFFVVFSINLSGLQKSTGDEQIDRALEHLTEEMVHLTNQMDFGPVPSKISHPSDTIQWMYEIDESELSKEAIDNLKTLSMFMKKIDEETHVSTVFKFLKTLDKDVLYRVEKFCKYLIEGATFKKIMSSEITVLSNIPLN